MVTKIIWNKAASKKLFKFGKHNQIYFRVQGKTLFISDFFDARQDPKKRPV